jgi:hypothetical protein
MARREGPIEFGLVETDERFKPAAITPIGN